MKRFYLMTAAISMLATPAMSTGFANTLSQCEIWPLRAECDSPGRVMAKKKEAPSEDDSGPSDDDDDHDNDQDDDNDHDDDQDNDHDDDQDDDKDNNGHGNGDEGDCQGAGCHDDDNPGKGGKH